MNAGRFFADNGSSHHKKQNELIKAFIALDRRDWELHLTGSAAKDEPSKAYVATLRKMAQNHPNIFIHPDISFAKQRDLFRRAAIYWHATGLGYDLARFPENQEHFGMTTVEAMSAGAVPVVYKSAGQLEVVREGTDGLLWKNIDELLEKTRALINNPALRQKYSTAATKHASDFDRQTFTAHLDRIIMELNHEKP